MYLPYLLISFSQPLEIQIPLCCLCGRLFPLQRQLQLHQLFNGGHGMIRHFGLQLQDGRSRLCIGRLYADNLVLQALDDILILLDDKKDIFLIYCMISTVEYLVFNYFFFNFSFTFSLQYFIILIIEFFFFEANFKYSFFTLFLCVDPMHTSKCFHSKNCF